MTIPKSFPSPRLLPLAAAVLSLLLPTLPVSAATELESRIESHIKSLRSKGIIRGDERTAWLVYDLSTGTKVASINEDASLQAASMIKPYLALAFFHQVAAGRLSYGPESRRKVELMIQKSDNDATNWVMRQTGGPAATEALLKSHYPALCQKIRIVEYIPSGGKTYRNQASAGDYLRFLSALWQRQLPRSDEILRTMALPGNDRLYTKVPSVPSGTQVYNKTGSTSMCCGDMGILVARGRDGRSYPYAVIGIIESSRQNTNSYSTWITRRANVIREVSNLAYIDMKRRHPL
ncbi:MAG TPA: class A beta-lactamase-related serine hydrolase [Bacteroidia bacterium]|nr:class A beta-lactamase-related serine hydrolase [Bacteroidia bacterium]